MMASLSVLLVAASLVKGWRSCDVTSGPFGAVGDGLTKDTVAIRTALLQCDEVTLIPPRAHAPLQGNQLATPPLDRWICIDFGRFLYHWPPQVLLPAGRSFLTGPLNLTSNQVTIPVAATSTRYAYWSTGLQATPSSASMSY